MCYSVQLVFQAASFVPLTVLRPNPIFTPGETTTITSIEMDRVTLFQ